MLQTKDSNLNALVKAFNDLAPDSKKLGETSTFVGGSVAVGTPRTISGFSCEVFTRADGVKTPWLAVRFTDGTAVSLRSFMGIPSLEGFTTKGSLPVDEYTGNTLPNGEREAVTREITATSGDFNAEGRYKPETYCINDFLNKEAEDLKGATVTYRGTALKPYVVRRPFGNQVPGGRAVISVDLWTVEKVPTAPEESTK